MSWTSTLDVPKTYAAAKTFFEGRRDKRSNYRTLKGTGNTWVYERPMARGEVAYAIHLHQTDIITYFPDGTVTMDNWDSATTNDRRDNAAKPLVRTATSVLGRHKAQRVLCSARWTHRSASWPDELHGIGLPADRPLLLDSQGVPVGWEDLTEDIWVPVPEEHKRRRELMRWARKALTPYLNAMETLGGVSYIAWRLTEGNLTLLRDDLSAMDPETDAYAERLAGFCHAYATEVAAGTSWSRQAFSEAISDLAPSKCVGQAPMWARKTVRTTQLKEGLDL